jgi:hypothetical protein
MNFTPFFAPTSFYEFMESLEDLHQIETAEWFPRHCKVAAFYTKILLATPALLIPLLVIPTGPDDF